MTCMCGDTHCSSCGPAQGNSRCPICRAWTDGGCEHFDEETGEIKPEFEPELLKILEAVRLADIAYAEQIREYEQFGKEYEQFGKEYEAEKRK